MDASNRMQRPACFVQNLRDASATVTHKQHSVNRLTRARVAEPINLSTVAWCPAAQGIQMQRAVAHTT
eukprot:5922931-Alexandrium_andersonii.AAC.1